MVGRGDLSRDASPAEQKDVNKGSVYLEAKHQKDVRWLRRFAANNVFSLLESDFVDF